MSAFAVTVGRSRRVIGCCIENRLGLCAVAAGGDDAREQVVKVRRVGDGGGRHPLVIALERPALMECVEWAHVRLDEVGKDGATRESRAMWCISEHS
eukprot:6190495-Pleurochrysis_carterae.AAC.5